MVVIVVMERMRWIHCMSSKQIAVALNMRGGDGKRNER